MATRTKQTNGLTALTDGAKPKAKMTDAALTAINAAAHAAAAVEMSSVAAREGKKGLDAHRTAIVSAGVKLDSATVEAAKKGMLATVGAHLKLAPNAKSRTKPLAAGPMASLCVALFASVFKFNTGTDVTDVGFTALDKATREVYSRTARRALNRLCPPKAGDTATLTPFEKAQGFAKRIAPDVGKKEVAKLVQAFKDALEEAMTATAE